MNERIKELAFNAAGGMLSYDEDGYKLSQKEVEKFAELIVSQCIFEVMYESTKEPSIDIQNFSVTVANRIKKHFGVKE